MQKGPKKHKSNDNFLQQEKLISLSVSDPQFAHFPICTISYADKRLKHSYERRRQLY